MKTLPYYLLLICAIITFTTGRLFADVPQYSGKVILVLDNTIATNVIVTTNIARLEADLVGDGWHVLTLTVSRGLSPADTGWLETNGPEVRQVRALIQADYNADTNNVKEVFLIGHVPVPYSGHSAGIDGNHFIAAYPADLFYGEMIAPYSIALSGWTDSITNNYLVSPYLMVTNEPNTGIFDETNTPLLVDLGVGRLDLYNMPTFIESEPTLLEEYLDKDHDFRWGNFAIQREAYVEQQNSDFLIFGPQLTNGLDEILGVDNVITNVGVSWFPEVDNTNYLIGYGGGYGDDTLPYGNPTSAQLIGSTYDFAHNNSQVVFVNLYGSFFGDWDQTNDFLRAPIANQYKPANGQLGYGLTSLWGRGSFLDEATLSNRVMGVTIGEADFVKSNLLSGYLPVNFCLMGDPTLRLYTVLPPSGLTAFYTSTNALLSWMSSSDSNILGYNIYAAPTENGPYLLINSNSPVAGSSFAASSILTFPNNFYMVRAAKLEITPVGTYTNMSEGIMATNPSIVPYLSIINGPVSSQIFANTDGYTNNAAAFTVDAVGIDTNGNDQLTYQWYENGTALTDGLRIQGSSTRALLIKDVQTNDAENYYVVVGLADGSDLLTNSAVSLTVFPAYPTANNDSYSIIRNTPTNFDVLVNDTSPMSSPMMSLVSVSSLSNPGAGTVTINYDNTIHFVPAETFLGTTTFSYVMADGTGFGKGTVTLTVVTNPADAPPIISAITNQLMFENASIYVPFTLSDDFTSPDNLICTVSNSNNGVVPAYGLTLFGTGANRTLQIIGGVNCTGVTTITLTITDYDLKITSTNFQVTIIPQASANLPQPSHSIFSTNGFAFGVSGLAGSYWDIYASSDLTNWTQAGGVTLNSFGTNIYTDNTIHGITNRFYKIGNDSCYSPVIGFIQIPLLAQSMNLIANQLDASPDDTLNSVFAQTSLPSGTILQKLISASDNYVNYTNSGGAWLPNGNATLAPGEAAFIDNPTTNACTLTFVGLVRIGTYETTFPGSEYSFVSSVFPLSGGIQTALDYTPSVGDVVQGWNQFSNEYSSSSSYINSKGHLKWSPSEPIISVGQGVLVLAGSTSAETWTNGYSPCFGIMTCTVPTVTNGIISTNSFTFTASGPSGSYWDVYASDDLTNWNQTGGVTLNTWGTNYYTDGALDGATNRFYKLSNGSCYSAIIGFIQIPMVAESSNIIANQLDASPDDTLNSVFAQTPLPSGTILQKWISATNGYANYTNSSGVWLPNGDATLAPGEAAFFNNPTTNAYTITFVGLVRTGTSVITFPGSEYSMVSSVVPLAGGLQTSLGYIPTPGDFISTWMESSNEYNLSSYINSKGILKWSPSEPIIGIGQGFFIQVNSTNAETWTNSYSPCFGMTTCTAPGVTNGIISTNSFTFTASGPSGSYWDVYASDDLTNWNQTGGVTLNTWGTNYYSDGALDGATNRFYKLSNGSCYSPIIGFIQIPMVAESSNIIANQLDASPDDTLNSVFAQTPLPSGTILQKWISATNGYINYTNSGGVWLPNGDATLAPGEAAFFNNPTTNAYTITFVGLVRTGTSVITFPGNESSLVSSVVPLAGGLQTSLGYIPTPGDFISTWMESSNEYNLSSYINSKGILKWSPSEPIIGIGQGFFIQVNSTNAETWTNTYSTGP